MASQNMFMTSLNIYSSSFHAKAIIWSLTESTYLRIVKTLGKQDKTNKQKNNI